MFKYSVYRLEHLDYGAVIYIERNEEGTYSEAWKAVQAGAKEQRLWKEEGIKKVRFLIDDSIMTSSQARSWAEQEYIELPKCHWCVKPMGETIFQHQFSNQFFCCQNCSDNDFNQFVSRDNEEYECEFR